MREAPGLTGTDSTFKLNLLYRNKSFKIPESLGYLNEICYSHSFYR